MPSDFLLAIGGNPGKWIKLHNNGTGTDYFSTAQSDGNGMYIHSAPPGRYTLYKSSSVALPPAGDVSWLPTGDTDYPVALTVRDDGVFNSVTVKGPGDVSPYAPNLPGAPSIPTPAGVSTGTTWDWGGLVYHTKAAGALVDGLTSDLAAFNAGVTAAFSNGYGGEVMTPSGTSAINGRILANAAQALTFAGIGKASIVQLKASVNPTAVLDILAGSGHLIRDLTLDGLKAGQSTSGKCLLLTSVTKSTVFNVRAVNSYDVGIQLSSITDSLVMACDIDTAGKVASTTGSNASLQSDSSDRIRIIGNRIAGGNDSGILFRTAGHSDFLVVGNMVHDVYYIGIAGGQADSLTVTANVIRGTLNSHGIDIGSADEVAVIGNVIQACYGGLSSDSGGRQSWVGNVIGGANGPASGIGGPGGLGIIAAGQNSGSTYLDNTPYLFVANQIGLCNASGMAWDSMKGDILIANNLLRDNVALGAGGAGIQLVSTNAPLGNVFVIGNKIFDDRNVKLQTYGIDIRATTYHVSAIHNDLRGNLTAAILDAGSATYTHGNLGYNPRGFLTAPVPAASTVILYNPFNCDCVVYINGTGAAALTAIAVGGIAMPVNATHIALGTGGTLTNNTSYSYRITALNPQGETLASVQTAIVTPAGPNTCSVMVRWVAVPGATGYSVYGRTAGGQLKMVTNIQATTWLDTGSIAPAGALPGADTTGNTALTGVAAAPAANSLLVVHVPWGNGIKVTYTTFVTANWQWQNAA